jgi:hypothetical protein
MPDKMTNLFTNDNTAGNNQQAIEPTALEFGNEDTPDVSDLIAKGASDEANTTAKNAVQAMCHYTTAFEKNNTPQLEVIGMSTY